MAFELILVTEHRFGMRSDRGGVNSILKAGKEENKELNDGSDTKHTCSSTILPILFTLIPFKIEKSNCASSCTSSRLPSAPSTLSSLSTLSSPSRSPLARSPLVRSPSADLPVSSAPSLRSLLAKLPLSLSPVSSTLRSVSVYYNKSKYV